jgi:FkbM family methyltransferase
MWTGPRLLPARLGRGPLGLERTPIVFPMWTRWWPSFPGGRRVAFRRDRFWLDKLAAVAVPIPRAAGATTSDALFLEEFDLHLGRKHAYFLDGLATARALKTAGARFWQDIDGQLRCEVRGITVNVSSLEEMQILQEIFVEGSYDISVPGPSLVWDIGMNVGISSLYFAARGDVQVVGYEPIGPTYELALANLDLNPSLRHAITAVHSGIGGSDRTEMVDYCSERRGSVGVLGAVGDPILRRLVFHLPVDVPVWKEALRLEDAVPILASMRSAHPGLPIIAKIDCEGAEYEIIDALYRSGDLASLHALIIEWHRNGPEQLQRQLADAGFTVISLGPPSGLWGRLYAVRVQPPAGPFDQQVQGTCHSRSAP